LSTKTFLVAATVIVFVMVMKAALMAD